MSSPEYCNWISRATLRPVAGISCMSPIAPARERTSRINRLSLLATPNAHGAGMLAAEE